MTNQERFVLMLNNSVKERMVEKEIAEQRKFQQEQAIKGEKRHLLIAKRKLKAVRLYWKCWFDLEHLTSRQIFFSNKGGK